MARHSTTPAADIVPETRDAGTHHEVRQFLDRLARALTHGDTATVVALWETPALVLGDTLAQSIGSEDELEGFFTGAKQRYNEQGIVDTRGEIVDLRWPTERMVIAEVRWPYLDARGDEVGSETSTYTLRRDEDGDLRLRVAVMHGVEARRSAHH
jgi:hypothetical protein